MHLRTCAVLLAALAATHTAGAETITVSCARSTASAPVFIAAGKGFFAAEGLEVKFAYFPAALPVAIAVVSRDADIGITGLSAGFYNLAGKNELKLIAGGGKEVPGAHLTPYVASNRAFADGLTAPKLLAGRTVGITTFGGPFYYDLITLAAKYRFPPDSMKLVPLQSFGNIVSSLKGGTIDAALLTSVAAAPLAAHGDAHIIGYVGDETPWQLSALFTSSAAAAGRRDMVERFLKAYRRATAAYDDAFQRKSNPGEAAALVAIVAQFTQTSDEEIRDGLGFIERDGRLDADNIAVQIATWKSLNMVDAGVDAGAIIDASYAPR